jgi:extradiol dioxygenase family protein
MREVGAKLGEVALDDVVFELFGHTLIVAVDIKVDGSQVGGAVGQVGVMLVLMLSSSSRNMSFREAVVEILARLK